MLIAHQSQDRFEQEHPDDVLAVVTVSFQRELASRERRHRLKVLWVPWRGTRANYIDYFRMTGHCRMNHVICFLYLNNVIWPESDGAIRSLTNGGHLRLQIRADDNTDWCSFEYTENVARQRRIFESSPEPADDPADAERSSSTVSEPRSRSRSRHPPDEESDSHSLLQIQPEEAASAPLLQLHTAISKGNEEQKTNATDDGSWKNLNRPALQDITNTFGGTRVPDSDAAQELLDLERPHVLDLWCANPGQAVLEPRSEPRVPLVLEALLQQAVRLFPLPGVRQVPYAVEVWNPNDILEIARELQTWGLNPPLWAIREGDQCISYLCGQEPPQPTVVYWHSAEHQPIFHCGDGYEDELQHMKFLDKHGFGRAAITEVQVLAENLRVVIFHNGQPTGKAAPQNSTDGPTPIAEVTRRTSPPAKISDLPRSQDAGTLKNQIKTGSRITDVRQIFGTGTAVLQHDLSELDLLAETRQALQDLPFGDPSNPYDRMLIYIDGSSMRFLKHKDPRHIEETGTPDSWSFVVLGEYADGRTHPLEFVGWTANRVIYDSHVDHYAGATHIGSDTAEREGLLWAGVWRLSVDIDTPTYFVSNSQIAGGFARGDTGTSTLTMGHYLVRGIHQALEQALGSEGYGVLHVRSHRGDPWNEFADVAAKRACHHYKYRPRQSYLIYRCSFTKLKAEYHHVPTMDLLQQPQHFRHRMPIKRILVNGSVDPIVLFASVLPQPM